MSMKQLQSLEDLTPDPHNANKGSERGAASIDDSLEKVGAARSIVVDRQGRILAGNHVHQKAVERGFGMVLVKTNGQQLVVVQRDDVDAAENPALAREIAYRDNRANELNLVWDAEQLQADLENTVLPDGLFSAKELDKLFTSSGLDISGGAPPDVVESAPKWVVLVECADEAQQTAVLEQLMGQGLTCRAMTS